MPAKSPCRSHSFVVQHSLPRGFDCLRLSIFAEYFMSSPVLPLAPSSTLVDHFAVATFLHCFFGAELALP
eukprot:g77689.t1